MYSVKYIISILVCIIIIILIYRSFMMTDNFINIADKVAGYELFTNAGLVFGNALIQRDGLNLEIANFGINSNKMNIILNSDGDGLTALAYTGTVKISLMDSKIITAIRTQGLKSFNIFASIDDVNYAQLIINSGNPFINIATNEISTYENLINMSTNQPMEAKYIKIVNSNLENATNVKIEVYGMSLTSISKKQTLQSGSSLNIQLYDEKAKLLTNGIYISDVDNNNPFLLVKMPNNYDHMVNFISFKSNIGAYQIKYGHSQNNIVYTIPSNGYYNGNMSESVAEYFYFPNPTMLNYISFVPIQTIRKSTDKIFKITEFTVYGVLLDTTDNKLKYVKNREDFTNLADPTSSTNQLSSSTDDIIKNIKTSHNICSTLEIQDQINNYKNKMTRNKQYAITLQQQDDDMKALESTIAHLQKAHDARIKNSDNLNLARYQKQKGDAAKVADLVTQRLDAQEKLDIILNLQPTSTTSPTYTGALTS